jgi:hypothetical protein
MDILHLNEEQIREMEMNEYVMAIDYSWNAYVHRRIDYWLSKAFGGKGSSGNTTDWTNINPVSKQLAKERRPPKKFLEVISNT